MASCTPNRSRPHGRAHSLCLTVPPLATIMLKLEHVSG
jgi:hypothetical protein